MRIYVLGDSISIQYGPHLQKYLEGMMEYSRKEGEEEVLLNLDRPQGANGGDSGMVLSFSSDCKAYNHAADEIMASRCGVAGGGVV